MKIKYLLVLLIFISCKKNKKSTFEEYDKHIWQAMIQFKDKDYESSLSNFLEGFKIKSDENNSDYFYAAASAFHLNKDELAIELIRKSILETNASRSYFDRFGEFNAFRSRESFKLIEQEYDSFTEKYFENLEHPEIYHEIDSLIKVDQFVRNNDVGTDEMIKTDSSNILRVIKIITKKFVNTPALRARAKVEIST